MPVLERQQENSIFYASRLTNVGQYSVYEIHTFSTRTIELKFILDDASFDSSLIWSIRTGGGISVCKFKCKNANSCLNGYKKSSETKKSISKSHIKVNVTFIVFFVPKEQAVNKIFTKL